MTDAFPLQWPAHVRRTHPDARAFGGFQVTPETATRDLLAEIARSGGSNPIISTNRPLRRDGLPRQGAREPEDPGVAVYFTRKGQSICIPCDTFDRVWKNIRAIGLSIRDMRGPESRGCAAITDQAFTGFAALPAPGPAPWHQVLGVSASATRAEVQAAYKARARDLGQRGAQDLLSDLNVARDAALKAVADA